MNLNALKNFIAIAQTGSLLAGAKRLGIAVSTLSRQMDELEKQLGVQLLERTTQGIKLTLIGQQCYEQAWGNINALDDLALKLQGDQTQLKGKLRLSIPQAFSYWWPVIQAFQRKYPYIDVHIVATDRKLDLLEEGIDVVVRAGDLQTDKFIAKKLMDIRLKLVASPKILQQFGLPNHPNELEHFPCACWSAISQTHVIWQLGSISHTVKPFFSTNDYYHLRHIALTGSAICDLPDFVARPHLSAGELIEVLPNFPFPTMPVHLLYHSHRHPSSIVRAYVDFCERWVQEEQSNSFVISER